MDRPASFVDETEDAADAADPPRRRPPNPGGVGRRKGMGDEVERVARALRGLAQAEMLRARHALREGAWGLLCTAWIWTGLGAATSVAAGCLVIGTAWGLSELFGGRPWAGILVAGVLFLIVAPLTGLAVRAQGKRRRLAALERELQREERGASEDASTERPR
jgi:hypothetical protein